MATDMHYQAVIFDLDGTLADTAPGILNSHRHTIHTHSLPMHDESILDNVIGGALDEIYADKFHVAQEDLKTCLTTYRNYYATQGIYQAQIYDGMYVLLQMLHGSGIKLGVATLKREDFACEILSRFRVTPFFDCIRGVDKDDTLKKKDLIEMCVQQFALPKERCVMIGDSLSDANGANLANVDFIGVGYGYGFTSRSSIPLEIPVCGFCDTVQALHALLVP